MYAWKCVVFGKMDSHISYGWEIKKSHGPFKNWFVQRICSFCLAFGLFYVFSWSSRTGSLESVGTLGYMLNANTFLLYLLLLKSFGCTGYCLLGFSVTSCNKVNSCLTSTTFISYFAMEKFKLNKQINS